MIPSSSEWKLRLHAIDTIGKSEKFIVKLNFINASPKEVQKLNKSTYFLRIYYHLTTYGFKGTLIIIFFIIHFIVTVTGNVQLQIWKVSTTKNPSWAWHRGRQSCSTLSHQDIPGWSAAQKFVFNRKDKAKYLSKTSSKIII